MKEKYRPRIREALITVILLCLGLRLASWLIAPLVPLLIVLGVVVTVLLVATSRR
jgi:CHASE2 domain-containing sensor protein